MATVGDIFWGNLNLGVKCLGFLDNFLGFVKEKNGFLDNFVLDLSIFGLVKKNWIPQHLFGFLSESCWISVGLSAKRAQTPKSNRPEGPPAGSWGPEGPLTSVIR